MSEPWFCGLENIHEVPLTDRKQKLWEKKPFRRGVDPAGYRGLSMCEGPAAGGEPLKAKSGKEGINENAWQLPGVFIYVRNPFIRRLRSTARANFTKSGMT